MPARSPRSLGSGILCAQGAARSGARRCGDSRRTRCSRVGRDSGGITRRPSVVGRRGDGRTAGVRVARLATYALRRRGRGTDRVDAGTLGQLGLDRGDRCRRAVALFAMVAGRRSVLCRRGGHPAQPVVVRGSGIAVLLRVHGRVRRFVESLATMAAGTPVVGHRGSHEPVDAFPRSVCDYFSGQHAWGVARRTAWSGRLPASARRWRSAVARGSRVDGGAGGDRRTGHGACAAYQPRRTGPRRLRALDSGRGGTGPGRGAGAAPRRLLAHDGNARERASGPVGWRSIGHRAIRRVAAGRPGTYAPPGRHRPGRQRTAADPPFDRRDVRVGDPDDRDTLPHQRTRRRGALDDTQGGVDFEPPRGFPGVADLRLATVAFQ